MVWRILKWVLILLGLLIVGIIGWLWFSFSGGVAYDFTPQSPILSDSDIEIFYTHPDPIGNVAAAPDQSKRVFFTVHPESRPNDLKVSEIINRQAIPYPSAAFQEKFNTPLGLFIDQQNRLWVIDHGFHGLKGAILWAFDLATNEPVVEYHFPSTVAEWGSFLNDLTVSHDGKYVFIADVSFFAQSPSLIVFDVENNRSRSLLTGHPSVVNQGYLPETPHRKMRFFNGLVDLMPGIDGIDINATSSYIYYAAMSHSGLYRVPVNRCKNFDLSEEAIRSSIEYVAKKPLSDGLRVDPNNLVYITDIEHQGIVIIDENGKSRTLVRDDRIQWADGLSFGGDGYCYLADSDIPNQMLQSKAHIKANAPYHIFRFRSNWY